MEAEDRRRCETEMERRETQSASAARHNEL